MNLNNDFLFFSCPHCNNFLIIHINDINCSIFRHAIFKNNFQQINPHEKKEVCDFLFNSDLIYGCGKPFKLIQFNNSYIIEKCDYI
jgi:hypothetical protein